MITEYYKGIRNYKYKRDIYNTEKDIKDLINENKFFHDAEVYRISIGMDIIYIAFEYEKKHYSICLKEIIWEDQTVDFEIGNAFIGELCIDFGETITTRIDGTDLCVLSKQIEISTSQFIDKFPDGVIIIE